MTARKDGQRILGKGRDNNMKINWNGMAMFIAFLGIFAVVGLIAAACVWLLGAWVLSDWWWLAGGAMERGAFVVMTIVWGLVLTHLIERYLDEQG